MAQGRSRGSVLRHDGRGKGKSMAVESMAFSFHRGLRRLFLLSLLVVLASLFIYGCRDLQKELIDTMEAGNLEGVKSIIERNPGLVSANSDGRGGNTLFLAVSLGKEDMVEYLLSKGANVNGRNVEGLRPLHVAALKNRTRIAGILLSKGAAVNAQDNDGETPLHYAVGNDSRDMADLLLAHGASATTPDAGGRSPIFYARSIIMASILITGGADPGIKDYRGNTPSQWAAAEGHPDVSRYLALREKIKP